MKKIHIKNYEEFTNEEINIKKALTGAALGAGLAFGSPTYGQNIKSDTTKKEYKKIQNSFFDQTKWGMTIEEVKQIYPKHQSFWLNIARTSYLVEVDNYETNEGSYKASFIFVNGLLVKISLESKKDFDKNQYEKIKNEISNKLGSNYESTNISKFNNKWFNSEESIILGVKNNRIFIESESNRSKNIQTPNQTTQQTTQTNQQTTQQTTQNQQITQQQQQSIDEKFNILRNELLKMKNEQTEVKLNLYRCHKEFRVGVGLVGIGSGLGILGAAQIASGEKSGMPLFIVGSVLSLAGSVVILDSHKFIGRASLTGIRVEFGGSKPEYKTIQPGDYFLYMGPGGN